MSAEYYIADEFSSNVLLHSMIKYDNIDSAFKAIDARRFAHKTMNKIQPISFVILRVQARIPFAEPADSTIPLE